MSDSAWQADRDFMLQQVRAEIASATLGRVERYKILVEDDPQILAGLDLFPRASSLMSRAMMEEGKDHPAAKGAPGSETAGPATDKRKRTGRP